MGFLKRPDPFLTAILLALIVGLVWPAGEALRENISLAGDIAVGGLFFLYGMRLRTTEIIRGLTNVKVQGLIAAFTYIVFPVLGFLTHPVLEPILGDGFALGFFYLTLLPSTIQSSVAFTSIARGDTPAALCAATISNIAGIFITPAFVVLLLGTESTSAGSMNRIIVQLLLPFIVGQFLQPLAGDFMRKHRRALKVYDQGTIVLIVLGATLSSTALGVWEGVTARQIALIILASIILLAIMLPGSWFSAKALGIDRPGQVAVMMCGSKKSLSTGLPMAQALFPTSIVGAVMVPVIAFHQIQLMVCATLASRLGRDTGGGAA